MPVLPLLPLAIVLQSAPPSGPPSAPPAAPSAKAPPRTAAPTVPHRLDGQFEEWKTLNSTASRIDKREGKGGPDFLRGGLAMDDRFAWLYLEFADPFTLQGAEVPIHLLIDSDGDPKTGATQGFLVGADLLVICSPIDEGGKKSGKDKGRGQPEGMVAHVIEADGSIGKRIPLEAIGLGLAPSHASREFELRFDRTDTRFNGRSWSLRATVQRTRQEKDGSTAIETLDELDTMRCLLTARATTPVAKAPASAVARADGAQVRVTSWNAELGAIFKEPDGFAGTLKAIGPDVLLFQELGKAKPEELVTWLNEHLPAGAGQAAWQVALSGGDLRTAVASRGSVAPAPFLDGLQRTTPQGDRDVRVAGAIVETGGKRLLAVSLHLKCCGKLDSSEDRTRAAEAGAIHDAIEKALAKLKEDGHPVDGVIVGGDFNLVGTRGILDLVSGGLDLDGSPLDIVEAMQLDGTSNTTWRNAGGQFAPGRLDWLLASGSSLDVRRSFVFSEEDLAQEAIEALALPAASLKQPSDHQPVVVDLVFRPAPAAAKATP